MSDPREDFIAAAVWHGSLDREVIGRRELLEVKTTSEEWDRPSDATECQVQWYLGVTGYRRGHVAALTGDMPNPIDPPNGCVFHPRCPAVMDICRTTEPLTTIPDADHRVACHLHPGPAPSRDHANAKGDVTI